jgi:cell division protein FtsB
MIRNAEWGSRKTFSIEIVGLVYFLTVVIAGVILVYQPAQVALLNQEARCLERHLHDLKLRNEDLKKMVASMESLTFIEAQARNTLGMVEPEQVKSVVVNAGPQEHQPASADNYAADEPARGIFAWLSRIAEFMKDSVAVAKGRQ